MANTLRPLFASTLIAVAAVACSSAVRGADVTKPAPAAKQFEVRSINDIVYYTGPDADKAHQNLDVYVPKGKKRFPVVVFVHGGAWIFGDKDMWGVHAAVGKMLARNGVGAVLVNYRLSPAVKHPEHIKDVARAVAWTKKNIAQYGGQPDEIVLCGHSAGGHLISLLSTDESFLKAEGLSLADIKGVVSISGVYAIPDRFFDEVFGKDPIERSKAAPLNAVHDGCPPFLIVCGDHDFPTCDLVSKLFTKALVDKKVTADYLELKDRNHITILSNMSKDGDPCCKALLDFVAKTTGGKK